MICYRSLGMFVVPAMMFFLSSSLGLALPSSRVIGNVSNSSRYLPATGNYKAIAAVGLSGGGGYVAPTSPKSPSFWAGGNYASKKHARSPWRTERKMTATSDQVASATTTSATPLKSNDRTSKLSELSQISSSPSKPSEAELPPNQQRPAPTPTAPVRQDQTQDATAIRTNFLLWRRNVLSKLSFANKIRPLDAALFAIYMCAQIAITTPVVLLPVMAADPVAAAATAAAAVPRGATFVTAVASLSTLGGAFGKFMNGFVCQTIGGRTSAITYLLGLSVFSFLLSLTSTMHGPVIAGMEFCASIMWTACTLTLAEHYESDPELFGKGVMILSLASTCGTLFAKTTWTALLGSMHWRHVAKLGAVAALVGAGIVQKFLPDPPKEKKAFSLRRKPVAEENLTLSGVLSSIKHVLGNKMFWVVGLAHAMAFLARASDKVLGAFFHELTNLRGSVCGGLTSSVTIGFVHGLVTGRKFHSIESQSGKRSFLARRYINAVIATLGLAACANRQVASWLGGPKAVAAAVTLASGVMASSMSFQFYQLPPAFAKSFGKNKAVCLSFLDGFGFLLGAPIWAVTSQLVGGNLLGSHGWTVAWTMIASLFTLGGVLMTGALPSVIKSVT